jgi:hypothetical protein
MTTKWLAALLMTAMSLPVWGQSQDRFALTAQQVAQAVSGKGVEIAGEQVSLLAKVVANDPNPQLDLLAVEPLGDRWSGPRSEARTLVKLGCHLPGTCLPFYAIVSWPQGTDNRSLAGSGGFSAAGNLMLKPKASVTIRAGARATLVMDDDRSHIQIAVITLESGMVGHKIRVASPDRKQIYYGEVIGANLLKRSF